MALIKSIADTILATYGTYIVETSVELEEEDLEFLVHIHGGWIGFRLSLLWTEDEHCYVYIGAILLCQPDEAFVLTELTADDRLQLEQIRQGLCWGSLQLVVAKNDRSLSPILERYESCSLDLDERPSDNLLYQIVSKIGLLMEESEQMLPAIALLSTKDRGRFGEAIVESDPPNKYVH